MCIVDVEEGGGGKGRERHKELMAGKDREVKIEEARRNKAVVL